ncbi:MarR family transcriptional regulator [Arsenicitalea aurantiaca]|uniref:MarR family transcriptional regulator n=1 Tax=Arsenicitalea aurantiaca TaxID=1783274 RepID=A0A433XM08_9HYPH|nr:MarR family transcriptional regulator [Arsenicitalea aurantiaca]RUT35044.1 MarR family transcriptional regulator [Arsenicitalea aurantiaca]
MKSSDRPSTSPALPVNLGWALASVLRDYQKQVEAVLADLPGGSRAFLVMSLVERETCQSQIAIAERLGLDKTTLTYLLDGLEKRGLIRRSTDPMDRRSRHINLTAEGTDALAQLSKAVGAVEHEILSRLSRSEADQFYTALVKVAGLAEARAVEDEAEICQAALTGS